jgi:excisionase family DNA binding protein
VPRNPSGGYAVTEGGRERVRPRRASQHSLSSRPSAGGEGENQVEDGAITAPVFPSGRPFGPGSIEKPDPLPAPEPPPAVITADELAALLRVNRKTVYEALARGDIPGAKRIGATYRIHRDAVLAWLASSQDRAARSRRNR